MARVLKQTTITLRPDQAAYIDSVSDERDRSRWIREAIDMRMFAEARKKLEIKEARLAKKALADDSEP